MQKVFIDTGFWLALFNKKDINHKKSLEVWRTEKNEYYISDFILFETLTFLNCSVKNHRLASEFLAYIETTNEIQMFTITEKVKERAIQVFKTYSDKSFSFTDCSSFVVMDLNTIKYAYTFDDHFKQMGYSIIQ